MSVLPNVLIVDDSAVARAVIRRTVNLSGVPVGRLLEAADGLAGLQVMAENPVGLVLADLNMPVMDGFEMIRHMRDDDRLAALPVVVLSSAPDAAAFAESQAGVRAFLPKPFTPEAVRDVLVNILGAGDAQ